MAEYRPEYEALLELTQQREGLVRDIAELRRTVAAGQRELQRHQTALAQVEVELRRASEALSILGGSTKPCPRVPGSDLPPS